MGSEIAIQYSMGDLEKMAAAIAGSQLFGLKTAQQALGLMLLCQAEGLHPAIAARDYHIIEGRPALKADAMLARFQQAGGKVEWLALTEQKVCARFTHPKGGSAEIEWTMAMAEKAKLSTKQQRDGGPNMWQKFPRQMLRSRVISEGIRTVYPAVLVGVYTPEEVVDFDPRPAPLASVTITGPEAPWDDSSLPEEDQEPPPDPITGKQATALSIALKEAGFTGETPEAKAEGRGFLAFTLGLARLESIKDLSKDQAQRLLDRFGEGENGSYRADKTKLEAAVESWLASKVEVVS